MQYLKNKIALNILVSTVVKSNTFNLSSYDWFIGFVCHHNLMMIKKFTSGQRWPNVWIWWFGSDLSGSCWKGDHRNRFVFGCFQTSEVLEALLHCEDVVFASHNWRLQEDFMRTFSTLPHCFPLDVINQRIVPLVFRKLHTAVNVS